MDQKAQDLIMSMGLSQLGPNEFVILPPRFCGLDDLEGLNVCPVDEGAIKVIGVAGAGLATMTHQTIGQMCAQLCWNESIVVATPEVSHLDAFYFRFCLYTRWAQGLPAYTNGEKRQEEGSWMLAIFR